MGRPSWIPRSMTGSWSASEAEVDSTAIAASFLSGRTLRKLAFPGEPMVPLGNPSFFARVTSRSLRSAESAVSAARAKGGLQTTGLDGFALPRGPRWQSQHGPLVRLRPSRLRPAWTPAFAALETYRLKPSA